METIEVVMPYVAHEHAQEIHRQLARHRFSVLVCHRRFGKTTLSVHALIDAALNCTKERGRFGYVAPFLRQAKEIAWSMLTASAMLIPGTIKNEAELWVEFTNGSRIRIYGADNPDSFRGLYFDFVVLDEVSDMKANIWGEILRPTIADRKGQVLFIGTPRGMDLLYDLYTRAATSDNWYSALHRADETSLPWLDRDELDMAREEMSENFFAQEFLCDFTASSDDILIDINLVARACAVTVPSDAHLAGLPKILGVDIARYGPDKSVIQRRWGHCAFEPDVYSGKNNMEMVGKVGMHIMDFEPDAVFIDGGRGEGVIDRLRELGHTVIEVPFGGSADDPHYANKRTEMWVNIKKWLESGGSLPNNSQLKSELVCAMYGHTRGKGQMILEAKDHIKERLFHSPDIADALALTFAYPVHVETPFELERYTGRAAVASSGTYDPYKAYK